MSSTRVVRERPILFSGAMVRAILDGRKTQTRRVLRVAPHPAVADWVLDSEYRAAARAHSEQVAEQYISTFPHGRVLCPYGRPGDRLWVRETIAYCDLHGTPDGGDPGVNLFYRADGADAKPTPRIACDDEGWHRADHNMARCERGDSRWVPSIFMPRWASRLTLEITSVRVERLQSISEGDCRAEGMQYLDDANRDEWASAAPRGETTWPTLREHFENLWDSLNAKRGYGWDVNPWVWILEFRVTP